MGEAEEEEGTEDGTKIKIQLSSLTGLTYRRLSWQSFTEIGAGFNDLDVVDDEVSLTS